MPNSLRVLSFLSMDASIGIKNGQRARGLLTDKQDIDAAYEESAAQGHRGMDEVLIGKNPVLKVNLTGKVLRLAGEFSARAPMSAIHKSVFSDCYNEISHGFNPESSSSGYWVFTGKLSVPAGGMSEMSGALRWFEPANDTCEIVAAPSAP